MFRPETKLPLFSIRVSENEAHSSYLARMAELETTGPRCRESSAAPLLPAGWAAQSCCPHVPSCPGAEANWILGCICRGITSGDRSDHPTLLNTCQEGHEDDQRAAEPAL